MAAAATGLLLLTTARCTGGDATAAAEPTGGPTSTTADPSAPTRTSTPPPSPADPVSIPALMERKHTGSNLRLGYTEDVIGAVLALRSSTRAEIDGDRIGLLGRSMGGGVAYNTLVVAPGLVDAAVVFAPVSSRPAENVDRFRRSDGDPLVAEIEAAHGTPEENPAFWQEVSPITYADRLSEPLLIHHGTADDTCPITWSRQTMAAFKAAGKDVQLKEYEGEGHAFGPQWPASMETTMDFFAQHLR
ncbi:alpha/beta hydrolase family protein [Streptomyces sp. NPDC087263]|uniref:alpha/beta hydrolase family protein n=1 Tax=Streptomyces sp. NPDC087263 TaxID=3365773 RepID=UPI00383068DE